jgi:hypothetical protein
MSKSEAAKSASFRPRSSVVLKRPSGPASKR